MKKSGDKAKTAEKDKGTDGGAEGSESRSADERAAHAHAETMRRMEHEHEIAMLRLKLESEERIAAMRGPSIGGAATAATGMGRLDPVSQCAKLLKNQELPPDAEVPVWFDGVEKMFAAYGVPNESRVHLIMPALSERVKYLFTRLSAEEIASYDTVKAAVLDELRLTRGEYRKRFAGARKQKDEGWAQFASRTASYFSYYLEARNVKSKEDLIHLMVADQVKSSLSEECLRHVTLREEAHELAKVVQMYEEAERDGRVSSGIEVRGDGSKPETDASKQSPPRTSARCFVCDQSGHIARNCPNRKDQDQTAKRTLVQGVMVGDRPAVLSFPLQPTVAVDKNDKWGPRGSGLILVELVSGDQELTAVLDTGSEITVVRESAVPPELAEPSGRVRLVSAFGQQVTAKLVRLPLQARLRGGVGQSDPVTVLCAVTDRLAIAADCLLSSDDWKLLNRQKDQDFDRGEHRIASPNAFVAVLGPVTQDGGTKWFVRAG
ncbi:hypothetical protein HPB47_019427 [Ixodes persulcatus]|uniref:Uncharacterized protein n=1 Tax=Ixodes persulcatus TaxID=34615 RepID=A0AC60QIA2_IXOPE|nr:hypothetical protein HPB47_019427 [Ixodes persulcatus]